MTALIACISIGATPSCAEPGGYNPAGLDTASLGRVHAICTQVMRLDPNEAHFGGCVDALSSSAAARSGGRAIAAARASCMARGLQADTPALAQCELEGAAHAGPDAAAATEPEPRSSTTYQMASNAEIFRREQLSCARLGLEPAGPAFGGCVRGLQSAMIAVDIPSQ